MMTIKRLLQQCFQIKVWFWLRFRRLRFRRVVFTYLLDRCKLTGTVRPECLVDTSYRWGPTDCTAPSTCTIHGRAALGLTVPMKAISAKQHGRQPASQ